jgi:sigma-B regulation protein RsbU (phosphoserine phosphatase)
VIGLGGVLPFHEGRLVLEKGDKFFLYTDGITEHRDEGGQFFGEELLYDLITELRNEPLSVIVERVIDSVMGFSEKEIQDDMSLLGFEFLSEEEPD